VWVDRRPLALRLRRHIKPLLALAGALILVGATAAATLDLPGPSARSLFGDDEEAKEYPPCKPSPLTVRRPAGSVPAGRWRTEPALPRARAEIDAATLGRRAYVFGGQTGDGSSVRTMASISPGGDGYSAEPGMPRRLDHTASAVHDGHLYVAGGYTDGNPTAGLFRYSPRSRRWTQLPSMRTPRGGHAGAIIGERLYVASGGPRTFPDESAAPHETLEIYDLARRRWSAGPDIPTGRHHVAATAHRGKLYVIGGRTPRDFSMGTVERYDPARGRWETLPPIPFAVGSAKAVSDGEGIILTGGDEERNWAEGEGWVTPAAWRSDPRVRGWRRLPDLSTARHGHAAAMLDGRLHVLGGSPCAGFARLKSAESLSLRASATP
jgi:N-acetylneuraminic acid mutarotase